MSELDGEWAQLYAGDNTQRTDGARRSEFAEMPASSPCRIRNTQQEPKALVVALRLDGESVAHDRRVPLIICQGLAQVFGASRQVREHAAILDLELAAAMQSEMAVTSL